MSIISIPLEFSYHGAEGNFRVRCKEVRELPDRNNPGETILRLVFDPHQPVKDHTSILYGINLPMSLRKGSKLRVFLEGWLGVDFLKNRASFNSDHLEGQWADIQVVHIHNDGFDEPFCNVVSASPSGTLVSEDQFRLQQGLPIKAKEPEQFELEFKPPELKKAA